MSLIAVSIFYSVSDPTKARENCCLVDKIYSHFLVFVDQFFPSFWRGPFPRTLNKALITADNHNHTLFYLVYILSVYN